MLSGIGDMYVRTTALSGGTLAQKMIPLFLFQFEFAQEAEQKEAQGFVSGKLVTKSTAEGSVTSTVRISTQYVDWMQLGLALNQFPRVLTSETVTTLKTATVPTSSPYEIADTAITTGNTNFIFVTIAEPDTNNQPRTLTRAATPASPATGEVGVDTTNNKLVFNAAQAGAAIAYTVPSTLATVQGYGGSGNLSTIGNIEFWGKIYSPTASQGMLIYFPNLQRSTRPTLTLSNDVPTLECEYGAIAPSGWTEPYKILNLNTAT